MSSDGDVQPPRALSPAFFGCFDWHSDVHGHWLLVRLLRLFPQASFAQDARAALARSFTPANIAGELAFFQRPDRASFERPYGLAWLLRLCAELRQWKDPEARWLTTFLPGIPRSAKGTWLLQPAIVTDRSDPKLAHLDGLNLSRAWMLQGIAQGLPSGDARIAPLLRIAAAHRDAARSEITGEHYEGGHWLGTFAVYLISGAGLESRATLSPLPQ